MISLCASAVETKKWDDFFGSLEGTKVPYEVVFVGDKRPDKEYKNLKFIYSEVKPAQCHQIAVMEASGDIIHITADDAVYPEGFLDDVNELFTGKRICVCCNTLEFGKECDWNTFAVGMWAMSPFAFFYKSDWVKLGGYDNRYLTGQFENDFCLRLHADFVSFVPYTKKRILVNHVPGSQFSRFHDIGRFQLRESWCDRPYRQGIPDGSFSLTRRDSFKPYDSKDILTKSQGATNPKWK
jgi:hypothetical protein